MGGTSVISSASASTAASAGAFVQVPEFEI